MKRKNVLVMTLVISALLVISTFGGVPLSAKGNDESLEVVKEVYDGEDWVNEIDAEMGETVQFRITITYHNITDPAHCHYAKNIVVTDILPDCLEYIPGTSDPDEPDVADNVLTWDLGVTSLYDGDSYVITFNTTVVAFGVNVNEVFAEADEHCTGLHISGEATATVNVIQPRPDISVEKYVWNGGCFWVKETSEYAGEIVSFKIIVENTGESNLYNIFVNDTLSESLEYVPGTATLNDEPYEPLISPDGKTLIWTWNILAPGETLEIIFNATVIGMPCQVDTNWVYVEGEGPGPCGIIVSDQDSAKVYINGMCMEKEVWDDDLGAWMESIDASIGDTVRFRIVVYYFGPKTLYNIQVMDVLPDCFVYANNAVPEEPEVSGNTLWWNLSSDYDLLDGQRLTIEFDAIVEGGLCDECVNWAYVVADECSGRVFEWQDPATVYVDCEFTADAGGPYYGDIDEEITITGSADDGKPPYTFNWDLDDDGEFDDATGATIIHSWSEAGSYIIRLEVTDDDGKTAEDYAVVNIAQGENNPPVKPGKPTGPSSGRMGSTYTYKASTTDPDGDQIMYLFDWGDGTNSGWVGPYDSGIECQAKHKWFYGSYSIKVKARDVPSFEESAWSDPLPISMPRSRAFSNPMILKFFELLIQRLPILQQILGL